MYSQKLEPTVGKSQNRHFMSNIKFFTCYGKEILETMFDDEKLIIEIRMRSDQLEIRPMLVKLLQAFAKHQNYSLSTLHLGIYFLDVYMDHYILSDYIEHQKLIGLVCLLLAAKSEDIDETVPSIKSLLEMVDMTDDLGLDLRYRDDLEPVKVTAAYKKYASMYCKLEFLIFESLHFKTIRPTVVSFINIFQNLIVTEEDVADQKNDTNDEEAVRKAFGSLRLMANDHLKQFLSLIIQDIHFFNSLPSQLAAAIIGATRKLLKIRNYWNIALEDITRYSTEDIRLTVLDLIEKRNEIIYRKSDHDNADIHKDSGYMSPNSASETDDEELNVVGKKQKLSRPGITNELM